MKRRVHMLFQRAAKLLAKAFGEEKTTGGRAAVCISTISAAAIEPRSLKLFIGS